MLGGSVQLTDVSSVVPLIAQNIRLNFESTAWAQQVALREQFGSAKAAELDWTVPQQLSAFHGPYDLIMCTDCVYHEHLVRDLARVILHCATTKTTGAIPILLKHAHPFFVTISPSDSPSRGFHSVTCTVFATCLTLPRCHSSPYCWGSLSFFADVAAFHASCCI